MVSTNGRLGRMGILALMVVSLLASPARGELRAVDRPDFEGLQGWGPTAVAYDHLVQSFGGDTLYLQGVALEPQLAVGPVAISARLVLLAALQGQTPVAALSNFERMDFGAVLPGVRNPSATGTRLAVSDLPIDVDFFPSWLRIPGVGVQVVPSLRLVLPTSQATLNRDVEVALAPGLRLAWGVRLLSGRWLRSLHLSCAGRAYAFAGSEDLETSWHINSAFQLGLQLTRRWLVQGLVELFQDRHAPGVMWPANGGMPSGPHRWSAYQMYGGRSTYAANGWLTLEARVVHQTADSLVGLSELPGDTTFILGTTLTAAQLLYPTDPTDGQMP